MGEVVELVTESIEAQVELARLVRVKRCNFWWLESRLASEESVQELAKRAASGQWRARL